MALRHDVQSGAMNLKDKLAIELQSDMRHGKVIYGGEVLNAKVCIFFVSNVINSIFNISGSVHIWTFEIQGYSRLFKAFNNIYIYIYVLLSTVNYVNIKILTQLRKQWQRLQ